MANIEQKSKMDDLLEELWAMFFTTELSLLTKKKYIIIILLYYYYFDISAT